MKLEFSLFFSLAFDVSSWHAQDSRTCDTVWPEPQAYFPGEVGGVFTIRPTCCSQRYQVFRQECKVKLQDLSTSYLSEPCVFYTT